MEKGLLFLTLSVGCLWLVLDEFFGNKRLSSVVSNLTPDFKNPVETFIQGSATPMEKDKIRQDTLNNIEKGKSSDSAKKAMKDAVNRFYESTGGRVY